MKHQKGNTRSTVRSFLLKSELALVGTDAAEAEESAELADNDEPRYEGGSVLDRKNEAERGAIEDEPEENLLDLLYYLFAPEVVTSNLKGIVCLFHALVIVQLPAPASGDSTPFCCRATDTGIYPPPLCVTVGEAVLLLEELLSRSGSSTACPNSDASNIALHLGTLVASPQQAARVSLWR